jgi:hypothetical protein
MFSRVLCIALICLFGLAPAAWAGERSGLIHRASCSVVRYYVAKYTAATAEMWARSKGATDAEIEAARQCLKGVAPQRPQVTAGWTFQ